eukprot:3795594-Rhodomonas_salina.2
MPEPEPCVRLGLSKRPSRPEPPGPSHSIKTGETSTAEKLKPPSGPPTGPTRTRKELPKKQRGLMGRALTVARGPMELAMSLEPCASDANVHVATCST